MAIICEIRNNIIHLYYEGAINMETYPILSKEGYLQIKQNRKNLIWHLEKTQLNVSMGELHLLQSQFPNNTSPNVSRFKIGALVNQTDLDKWIFAENISANFGYQRKVFLNENQAINWLNE